MNHVELLIRDKSVKDIVGPRLCSQRYVSKSTRSLVPTQSISILYSVMPSYTCKHCQLTLSDRSAYNQHISHCIPSIDVKISEGQSLHFRRKDGQFHCTCYGQRCSKTYDTTTGFERHVKKTRWYPGEGQENTPGRSTS